MTALTLCCVSLVFVTTVSSAWVMPCQEGDDSSCISQYYSNWQRYRFNDPDTSIQYARQGLSFAKKVKEDRHIAAFYMAIGQNYNDKGSYDSALCNYQMALKVNLKLANQKGIAAAYSNIGGVYSNRSDSENALRNYLKALDIVRKSGDKSAESIVYSNIGAVYFLQEDWQKAKKYELMGLAAAKKAGRAENMAMHFNGLANISQQLNDTAAALRYYDNSLRIYQQAGNKLNTAIVYSQKAPLEKDRYKSLALKLKAQAIFDSVGREHVNSIANIGNIGQDYLEMAQQGSRRALALSERYLKDAVALSKEAKDPDNAAFFLKSLGELEELIGNPVAALAYYKEHYRMNDSLFSQLNKNKLAEIETHGEIELRDKQIQMNKLALATEKKIKTAWIAGALVLLLAGVFLYAQSRKRRKTNQALLLLNKELDAANKIKAKFFGLLSHDLRSPIADLMGLLKLQRDAPGVIGPEKMGEFNKDIAHRAEELLVTIDSTLLWSKSQMEHFAPVNKIVKVSFLLNKMKQLVPGTCKVNLVLGNAGDLEIVTDAEYLKTIMQNLTTNAVKALKNTYKPQITWSVSLTANKAILTITDNGPGIKQGQLEALYNERVAVSGKHGLGLHLIRDMAKAIGCRITLHHTQPGKTTFALELPNAPAKRDAG